MPKERAIAAMSGGVDSAVAAGLLAESGYDVVGVTMKMYAPTRPHYAKSCCGSDDVDDARRSAATLGIPHYVLDFQETFRRNVVEPFAAEYAAGRTPNPCVSCNNFVKLGTLAQYADRLGARHVATGHYARIEHRRDGAHLFASRCSKDQAYALAQLAPAQLDRLLLPLGELDKTATRAHARRLGLPVHDKAESQDICFVEGGDYREVVRGLAPSAGEPGPVLTAGGERIGTHEGVASYTVGQRARLPAADGPRYVVRIDAGANAIVVGTAQELSASELVAGEVNLIRPERFGAGPVAVRAMIRYRATPAAAQAALAGSERLEVRFDAPQRAVSPGQLVALLDPASDEMLAGATILSAGSALRSTGSNTYRAPAAESRPTR